MYSTWFSCNVCNQGKNLCSPCITYIFMYVNVFSGGDSLKAVTVCIPRSFLVINVCNQGKTLCSPCITYVFMYVNVFLAAIR